MSVEIHDKLIKLLADVDELKANEATLQAEKQRHIDQIAQSEGDLQKCIEAIKEVHANVERCKGQMDSYRDELFGITEGAAPTNGETHEGDDQGRESEAKRLWKEQVKRNKLSAV
jgi:hypothetical protein